MFFQIFLRPYLEVVLKADEEGEGDGLQDLFLVQRVLDLLQLYHLQKQRNRMESKRT